MPAFYSRHSARSPGLKSGVARKVRAMGYSLVELMVVLAIVTIVATIGTTSVGSIMQGRAVANAVNIVSNSAAVARQAAISKGKPVAFVLSRPTGTGADDTQSVLYMMFNGLDADGNDTWIPESKWTALPARVSTSVLVRNTVASFYPGESGAITTLPALLKGVVPAYDYIVFQPDGSVDAPGTAPSLIFSRLGRTNPGTDYTLVLQTDSGRSKIIGN